MHCKMQSSATNAARSGWTGAAHAVSVRSLHIVQSAFLLFFSWMSSRFAHQIQHLSHTATTPARAHTHKHTPQTYYLSHTTCQSHLTLFLFIFYAFFPLWFYILSYLRKNSQIFLFVLVRVLYLVCIVCCLSVLSSRPSTALVCPACPTRATMALHRHRRHPCAI